MSGISFPDLLTQIVSILAAFFGLVGIIVSYLQAEKARHIQESLQEIHNIEVQIKILEQQRVGDEEKTRKLGALQARLEDLLAQTQGVSRRPRKYFNLLPLSILFLISGTLIFLVTRSYKPTPVGTSSATPTFMSTDAPLPTDTSTFTPVPTDISTDIPLPTGTATTILVPTEISTETPSPTASETLTLAPTDTPTETPTATLAPVCSYQGNTDNETIVNLIQAEALGVNQKSIDIMQAIFTPNAIFTDYSQVPPQKWIGPIARYQDDLFMKYEFKDFEHIDIAPVGPGILDNTAWYVSGSTGFYRPVGSSDWIPLANGSKISATPPATKYGSEHWILQKNDLGCWVIMQLELNAGRHSFP